MFPEIVRFGPLAIYTYGFMMMLAFAVGVILTIRRGRKIGIESGIIWDLALWILFSSLIGSRALYVLTNLDEFRGNWLAVINPVQPDGRIGMAGMVLLGGVISAFLVSIIFIRRRKLRFWQMADLIAPALILGIGLGRIGCFANGCCYGEPTHSCLGVVFPPTSPAGSHFPGTPVLPTQLLEAVWSFLLFGGLLFAERWKKFDGYTFALFLIGYAIFRIWVDTVRIYNPSEILINTASLRVTVSQAISVGMMTAGILLFWIRRRKQMG
ncbi:MAG: prolipoprotein diacylglyceryl transferase [bacterium]